MIEILGSEGFHLNWVHRCTGSVFKEFQDFCSPLARIGHQHEGLGKEKIDSCDFPGDTFVDRWISALEQCIENLMQVLL